MPLHSQSISEETIAILQNPVFYDTSVPQFTNIEGLPIIQLYSADLDTLSTMQLPDLIDCCEEENEHDNYLIGGGIFRITQTAGALPSTKVSHLLENGTQYEILRIISQKILPLCYEGKTYEKENILDLYAFYTEHPSQMFLYYVTEDGVFIAADFHVSTPPIVLTQEVFLTLMPGYIRFLRETNASFFCFDDYIETVQGLSLDEKAPPKTIYEYRASFVILSAVGGFVLGAGGTFCLFKLFKRKKKGK